jgi:hypothetical protein
MELESEKAPNGPAHILLGFAEFSAPHIYSLREYEIHYTTADAIYRALM